MQEVITETSPEALALIEMIDNLEGRLAAIEGCMRPTLMGESYMTDAELSELLKTNRRTIQTWRTEGRIGYIQIANGKVLYACSEVERFLNSNLRLAWNSK